MAEQYDHYQFLNKAKNLEKTKEAAKVSNEQMNFIAGAKGLMQNLESNVKAEDIRKANKYKDSLLKDSEFATLDPNLAKPLIFKTEEQQAEFDALAELRREAESLDNSTVIEKGEFRFNDQKLDINPEQISLHIDEYENSVLFMRTDTPVTT